MRRIFLFALVYFHFTLAFAQKTEPSWGPWVTVSCYKGIQYSINNLGYNKSTNSYWWNIRWKNNYAKAVSFDGEVVINGENAIHGGWGSIQPGGMQTYTSVPYKSSSTNFTVRVTKVCFADRYGGCSDNIEGYPNYAECDNGTPNFKINAKKTSGNTQNGSAIISSSNKPVNNARPQQNNLDEYNKSKADLESQIEEKNAEGQQKSQNYNNTMNAGILAHNSGNYTEAKNQFSIALRNSNTEEARVKAQEYYNKSVNAEKSQSTVRAIETVKPALLDVAKSIDASIAANRERKAAVQAEKDKIEEQRNNEIINNQDYYFRITSKDDTEIGEYCDYIVNQFQKAGYTFIELANTTLYRKKTDGIEVAYKTIEFNIKNDADTLNFRMQYSFTLGKYVNKFIRRCWLTSKRLKRGQSATIAKEVLNSAIELDKNFEENACFEFLLSPQMVTNSIKNYDFSNTNYKGFDTELKKANTLKTEGSVKSYLSNGYKFYQNLSSGDDNNTKQAIFWYTKAADSSNTVAMRFLSNLYFKENNYDLAEQWTNKAIQLGDTYAYTSLGGLYQGIGKYDVAVLFYKKAVEANHLSGYYSLANAYREGVGVEKDGKEAERLYLIGANKNDFLCMSGLELLYQYGSKNLGKSKSKANDWHEKKCKAYPQYCK